MKNITIKGMTSFIILMTFCVANINAQSKKYKKSTTSTSKKKIKDDVDRIFNDNKTGQLPTFEKRGDRGTTTSAISIENGTGCSLTVRYSGADINMIIIPAGSTRSVTLKSGLYRIAASACGSNYAGEESLSGRYSSRYYISSSRY